jgi:CHAT domain-containing protein
MAWQFGVTGCGQNTTWPEAKRQISGSEPPCADWVVLSACNTAADGAPDAEGLSGLAKAFFYAGARSILVSHWSVESKATVKLITGAFAELKKDPTIGRTEALRRAELAMLDPQNPPEYAHPLIWAPFVLAGEGGAGR